MGVNNVVRRWLRWNMLGEGKSRSLGSSNKFSYDGEFLFANTWPSARLEKRPKSRQWINLTRGHFYVPASEQTNVVNVYVPCVGCFSKIAIDSNSIAEHHVRLRWLWEAMAMDLVKQAQGMKADGLLISSWASGEEQLRRQLDEIEKHFDTYSKAFGLGWGPLPQRCRDQLNMTIERRKRTFYHEKNIAARERAAARRAGKKAFGIE